jgi:hypothetical protein
MVICRSTVSLGTYGSYFLMYVAAEYLFELGIVCETDVNYGPYPARKCSVIGMVEA